MKPGILLTALMIGMIMSLCAQRPTIALTFTGDNNGQHVPMTSIFVENLTLGGDTTLYAPDTVLVLNYITGMEEVSDLSRKGVMLSQNYPNPMESKTTIDIFLSESENVILSVSDVMGREIIHQEYQLEPGSHSFTFLPGRENLYYLTARADQTTNTIKMFTSPASSSLPKLCALKYNGFKTSTSGYKEDIMLNNFEFNLGNQLQYTASSSMGEQIIIDIPGDNQLYTFQFGSGGIPCPGIPTVTDIDGNVYNTVLIGTQCWMKENLKVGTRINGSEQMTNNGIIEKYCYDDELSNCEVFGGLYTYAEMMQYDTTLQGICPEGWHLPSDLEWCILETFVDASIICDDQGYRGIDGGGKLKETGTIHWAAPNTGATNTGGYTGLPGGYRTVTGTFNGISGIGNWWTHDIASSTNAWYRGLAYNLPTVYKANDDKSYGFSVRCIKDNK